MVVVVDDIGDEFFFYVVEFVNKVIKHLLLDLALGGLKGTYCLLRLHESASQMPVSM